MAKPSEPPAGVARLAGALRAHGAPCRVIDANLECLHWLLEKPVEADDTWSRRALKHRHRHLSALASPKTYGNPTGQYGRAVSDLERLLSLAGKTEGIRIGLANYSDERLSPVRSADLLSAARNPERSPYYRYFNERIVPKMVEDEPSALGISINYLSQALPAFALIGLLKRERSEQKIILGGGLVTSWLRSPDWTDCFEGLVDQLVDGPGEAAVLSAAGLEVSPGHTEPDYSDFIGMNYLSPGFVLPFSTSDGCWWNRCTFCPERSEDRPFQPLPRGVVMEQLHGLVKQTNPSLIHLLDNAVPPVILRQLADQPPGAPWYGFARIGAPLDDPLFCRKLAESGCLMLKLGLESGSRQVLAALGKGIVPDEASTVLENLRQAGIAVYLYLLFGTPAEGPDEAKETWRFTLEHREAISFLNLAIFNLPRGSREAAELKVQDFYPGDLALYHDFIHPRGWDRPAVRRFLDGTFRKQPEIRQIIRRDPPTFTSNHAAFFVRR